MAATEPGRDLRAERRALAFLLLVVFINIAGFGIVIPLLPFYAETFGIAAWQVTILFSVYSIGQLFGESLWGRLSDRIGRRPVLIGTMLLGAGGYALLAFTRSYEGVLLLRLAGGLVAGNISTTQAYIVDITPPRERVTRLGLIGATFGLGFVLGPAIGGLLADPSKGPVGFRLPLLVASGLALLAVVGILLFVRESRQHVETPHDAGRFAVIGHAWHSPVVRNVVAATIVTTAALSAMESTFALWVNARFQWGPREVGLTFAFIGIMSAITQGLLVGRVARRIGEANTLALGLAMTSVSLFVQTIVPSEWMVVAITAFTVFGVAITQPSIAGLISRATSHEHQGAMLGLNGSAGAMSRILGPLAAGFLFSAVGVNAPYRFAAIIVIPAILLALRAGWQVRRLET